MDLKYNINKIHGELLNNFETVKIEEKSNKENGNHFLISAISEGKEVKFITTKQAVESGNIDWKYFSNPLNENSGLVERNSKIYTLTEDIKDVISKNRFDKEYLSNFNN